MKIRIYTLFSALLALASCKKDIKVELGKDAPNFDVTLDTANTYKAGSNVTFNFTGNADIISFYSGELYREHSFKDGRVIEVTNPTLSFTSAVTGGTQTNQLTVLASTDFNGIYNDTLKAPLADIHAATWVDITSRFALGTSGTFLASGAKNISDLVVEGKPLYIAFKYDTRPQAVNGDARSWMIQSFALTGAASVGTLTLGDMTNSGLRIVDGSPETAPTRSSVAATRVTFLGNTYGPANDPATEAWAVSKAFNTGTIDMGPDRPVGIKGIANSAISNYAYKYTKPGTYKVSFVAMNANAYEAKQVVKEVEITIIP